MTPPLAWLLMMTLVGPAAPAEPLKPAKQVREFQETRQPERLGWLRRLHRFDLGNGTTIEHAAYIEPTTRRPINKAWADVVLRYEGPGGMNWSPWYWLHVYVTDLKGPAADVIYSQRLREAHFLPGAERTLAEFVWEAPRPDAQGQPTEVADALCLRLAACRGDRRVWVDLWLAAEGPPRPVRVQWECYPSSTKGLGWQDRVRWAATPADQFALPDSPRRPLDPARDWAIIFFNRQAETQATCQFVYVPEQFAGGSVAGTYGVHTILEGARGVQRFQFVFDQQRGQEAEQEVKRFLAEAPRWQQELRRFDWSLPAAAVASFRQRRSFLDELLAGRHTRDKFGRQIADIDAQFHRLVKEAPAEPKTLAERLALWQAAGLLDELDRLKGPMLEYHITHDLLGD